jgi:hypothetical protein
MFPRQVGEFAYADLKAARKYSWFPQLREQLLPPQLRQFERFLSAAGVDPSTHVEELAWGELPLSTSVGEEAVGVALGWFDASSIEERFKQQKLPLRQWNQERLERHFFHVHGFQHGGVRPTANARETRGRPLGHQ